MNELEIRKIAKEEFMNNVMSNIDSTLIFTYIQNLERKVNNLQSKIDKVIKLCETEKKYIYDYAGRDEKTGKLLKGNKIELDFVNKSKIIDILKEDK